MNIMRNLLITAVSLAVCSSPALAEENVNAAEFAFFGKLVELLPGSWEGAYANGTYDNPTGEWTPLRVDYYITSGGTAIVEDYLSSDESEIGMSTVYHLDNNDIRATHFCGAMNHPRMISRGFDADSETLYLDFVDVSNLKLPGDYHSRGIDLTVVSEDNVRILFRGLQDGEDSLRTFNLHRMRDDG